MCPEDLRAFLRLLEEAAQLARISADVSPELELATIVERVSKGAARGQALYFDNVRGGCLPVAANLYGTIERVGWALGTTDLAGLAERLAADLRATGHADPAEALFALTQGPNRLPTVASQPDCREVDHGEAGLDLIPPIKAWPGDGGSFLTLAQVYTRHPDGGDQNCGLYRVQRHDRMTATIRCRAGSGAAGHLAAWHERGRAMPVAIALGGPPALAWAAAAPLPVAIDETVFCGYLTGRPLIMSTCQTSDLQVPAKAEIVIEGVVEPGSTRGNGPFGNHTGSYDFAEAAPAMKVLSVHARHGAIYPWTLVGPPPMENSQLARATVCLFLPLVRMVLPTVRDLHLPAEGIFHRAALLTVDPSEQRSLKEIAGLLWSTLLLKGARLLVIGAADHDPRNPSAFFWRALNRVDWRRDILIDGEKLAVDARRLPVGEPVGCDPAVLQQVLTRWQQYGLDRY